ncbi:cell division control protein Cdc6 [Sulfolobales archaeon HS-7]|nr:cell division control protein Cdc6 [Sulfolobales archaeon HS-7]
MILRVKVNSRDLLNSVIGGKSVFKNRGVLSPEFIPQSLPHREEKIRELGVSFRSLITSPGEASIRTVIVGPGGVGKTATSRAFGKDFKELAREKGIRVEYLHLNCHKYRTLYLLVNEMANQLHLPLPSRGFSSQELLHSIHSFFDKRDVYAVIGLDEFDYFINTASQEEIYFLARIYDELNVVKKRINYIFIIRDKNSLNLLDKSVYSHIVRTSIEFKPYTSYQLLDILSERIKDAFYPGTVLDEGVRFVSDYHGIDKGGSGNARIAIEVLEAAGEMADKNQSDVVTVEYIKEANARVSPDMTYILEDMENLELHQLLLLKAILVLYKEGGSGYLTMGSVEDKYAEICKEVGEENRRHTQVYENIRRLKLMGVIDTSQSGKGMRGRTTLIALKVPSSVEFEEMIDHQIKVRLLS